MLSAAVQSAKVVLVLKDAATFEVWDQLLAACEEQRRWQVILRRCVKSSLSRHSVQALWLAAMHGRVGRAVEKMWSAAKQKILGVWLLIATVGICFIHRLGANL